MAITANSTLISKAKQEAPAGYTVPQLGAITGENAEFETDIAISNAHASNAVSGLNNVIAAIQAYFISDYALNTLKLNATLTINANLFVSDIQRVNTAGSIYITGTEVFRCTVKVVYN